LLEPHQLIVDGIQALAGFRQKLSQQIIHHAGLQTLGRATFDALSIGASFPGKRLILVE
jgi:hypothetical protein